jgi:hypothetical protein
MSVVYQPDCPLEIKDARYLHYLGGGGLDEYTIRNRGTKAVIAFKIATVGIWGGGSISDVRARNAKEWIPPGGSWPQTALSDRKIVPMTPELRDNHRVGPPMKGVFFIVVVRVDFDDGTYYSDVDVYDRLKELCEKISPPEN